MSESEIRKLLERACRDIDRYARKVALPGAVGAGLAIGACGGTPKADTTTDPVKTDGVEVVADAGVEEAPPPDPPADAAPPPVEETKHPGEVKGPPRDIDIPRPYMAPDAEPLYRAFAKKAVC